MERTVMLTHRHLTAMLAVLGIDSTEIEDRVRAGGHCSAETVRCALASTLYQAIGAHLHHTIVATAELTEIDDRVRAIRPGTATVPADSDTVQAKFEAFWLVERITTLRDRRHHSNDGSDVVAALVEAAHHAATATKILLRLRCDACSATGIDPSHPAWDSIKECLARAHTLTRTTQLTAATSSLLERQ